MSKKDKKRKKDKKKNVTVVVIKGKRGKAGPPGPPGPQGLSSSAQHVCESQECAVCGTMVASPEQHRLWHEGKAVPDQPPPQVGNPESNLERAVYQAIGAASMCWSEPPDGVFDSERAEQIGKQLLLQIKSLICAEIGTEFTCTLPPYLLSKNEDAIMPGRETITANEAIADVWRAARDLALEAVDGRRL
jgi:hypothetical protein